jgi:hypothetical protein
MAKGKRRRGKLRLQAGDELRRVLTTQRATALPEEAAVPARAADWAGKVYSLSAVWLRVLLMRVATLQTFSAYSG